MNNPLISVIVPVYNVQNCLERCLKSIINQTYKNIEIILIDDGSTDMSAQICDEYKLKDSRIVCIHKDNTGLADVRNIGVAMANGEYITFVDSDDAIDVRYVEELNRLVETTGCTLSLCTHRIIKKEKEWAPFRHPANGILDAKTCIGKMLYSNGVDTSAWGKLYKKSLFKDVYYPKGKIYEDIATTYKLFIKAGKIACTSKAMYNYILRDNSIVSSSFDIRNFNLIELTDSMGNSITKAYPDLMDAVLRRRIYSRFSTLNKMLEIDGYDNRREELIAFIKSKFWFIFKNANVPNRDKIAVLALLVNYRLYKFVWLNFGKK